MGRLLFVVVLAVGVLVMHTLGHPDASSGAAMGGGSHGMAAAGHGAPVQVPVGHVGSMGARGATDPGEGPVSSAVTRSPVLPQAGSGTSMLPQAGSGTPVLPQAGSGTSMLPQAVSQASVVARAAAGFPAMAYAVSGVPVAAHAVPGSHRPVSAMNMLSLCLAVLFGAWALASVAASAFARGSEWLAALLVRAHVVSWPGPPPRGPDLTRLSVLRQ